VDVERAGRCREEGAAVRCSWSPPLHDAERTAGVLARVLKSFGLGFIFVRVSRGVPGRRPGAEFVV
jgi:hypothetical protein